MATGIEACIPEWTREVSTYSTGELLKKHGSYYFSWLFSNEGHHRLVYEAWLKVLSKEIKVRGLVNA